MDSIQAKVQKVSSYKTWSDKRKVDALLEMDAIIYTNMGTDSTKEEKSQAKKESLIIYKAIKEIDPLLGFYLLYSKDK